MSIDVLIIEDEKPAADKLARTLNEVDESIVIKQICPSIQSTLDFLRQTTVDLIFSDIELEDGISFRIFEQVQIDTPIVFTTAYDKYAIQAFTTNSIDYLLKPIKKSNLERAIEKYKRQSAPKGPDADAISKLLENFGQTPQQFKQRFLVQSKASELISLDISEIAYFFGEGKYTYIVSKEGNQYFSDDNLKSLIQQLNPKEFYQLNRQFITHINSISRIINYSKSRLKIELNPPAKDEIIVSTDKASDFKTWLGK